MGLLATQLYGMHINMAILPHPRPPKRIEKHDTNNMEDIGARKFSPAVICLCGSTRFKEAFDLINMDLTLRGYIVISVGCSGHVDYPQGAKFLTSDNNIDAYSKKMLDKIHFCKIDLADAIMVINVGGYIGSSTRKEINYAEDAGKKVYYMFNHLDLGDD